MEKPLSVVSMLCPCMVTPELSPAPEFSAKRGFFLH